MSSTPPRMPIAEANATPELLGRVQSPVKRAVDVVASAAGLLVAGPLLAAVCAMIWLEDRNSPFYIADRVGRHGRTFRMVKLRSMVVNADKAGIDSTAGDDRRITRAGQWIRRLKLDEVSQLWNVLKGDMSLVGPRPNVVREVALYSTRERELLTVRPGITDFASIVFADEGSILEGADDPDLRYHQIIRPWKNRLALHYLEVQSVGLDLRVVLATILQALSRPTALRWVGRMLEETGAESELIAVARRRDPLRAAPPPGLSTVVEARPSLDLQAKS